MAYHRQDAKKANRHNTLIYPLMLNYGLEQYYIELVEEYPCENSNQLEKREGGITREMKASLNMKVSGRTKEEYKVEEADKNLDKVNPYEVKDIGKTTQKRLRNEEN